MGALILGKSYRPGIGECYVEQTEHKDFFRLRHTRTGYAYYVARNKIQWRKSSNKGGTK